MSKISDGNFSIVNGILLNGYISFDNLVIPEGVTCISEGAFANRNNSNIVSLTLSGSLKTIEDEAFLCATIESVNIPNGVTSIGERAFGGCPWLEAVTIPSSVTHIGDKAFGYDAYARS